MDIMGDSTTGGGVSGDWDQSDGNNFDGEVDSSLILLPGTVNFHGLTNPADVTFLTSYMGQLAWNARPFPSGFQPNSDFGGGPNQMGIWRGMTFTPRGPNISDGWDVAIAPSASGSFDGWDVLVQCINASTSAYLGNNFAYFVPPGIGVLIFDPSSNISYNGRSDDYYLYKYSTVGPPAAFTFYFMPVINVLNNTWTYSADADAGITFTEDSNGWLQVDVDLSLMTSGTGTIYVEWFDNLGGGHYPRRNSTKNLFSGRRVIVKGVSAEVWDQTDGQVFDGESAGSFLLLPGTVNFGPLVNAVDVTMQAYYRVADQWSGSLVGSGPGIWRSATITPHGTLITDGWDVAIDPSGVGSFDGYEFYVVATGDLGSGVVQIGPPADYAISPQRFGFFVDQPGSDIVYTGGPGGGDYYYYQISVFPTVPPPFTFYCVPYGNTGAVNWNYATNSTGNAGFTFTPLTDGRLQVDVDFSAVVGGNGTFSIQAFDDGTTYAPTPAYYPRTASTHNAFSGSSVLFNVVP